MRSRFPDGHAFAAVVGGLLIFGLFTLRNIPFYEPFWGLDFQNVYAFQTCAEALRGGVYSISEDVCGDALDRPFFYPPAMFHAFSWVRWFTFSQALAVWDTVMILAMVGVGATWLWLDRQMHSGWRTLILALFWLGLMAGFPFVFALERSNNDIIPLALWTAATALFVRRRFALSGGLMGVATMLKIYPVVAVFTIVVGLGRSRWRTLAVFGAGGLSGAVLASALWWPDTVHYFTVALPVFAAEAPGLETFSHTMGSLPLAPFITIGISAMLLASWAAASWIGLARSPLIVLAGSFAISTYFSSTSWDYNLISAYPLILLTTARALDPERPAAWKAAALFSVFALVAGRGVVPPAVLVLLQIATLVGIAWLVILDVRAERDEALNTPVVDGTQS